MIDFHCHILPGLDDGSKTIEESIEMAEALQNAGFTAVYCTPHLIKGAYEADNEAVRTAAAVLQKRLNNENIGLELFPGREYYLDEFLPEYLKYPLPLGGTNFIMLEIPIHIPLEFIKETCFRIKCSGFIPMIAHPERCSLFGIPQKRKTSWFQFTNSQRKAESSKPKESSILDYLKDLGCAFQGNLGSFIGLYGSQAQKTANHLRKMEIYTHFGTDLHSRAGIKYLNGEVKGEW
ncbi:MAG: CpsB/CapC family capsule biosynthesis tyrosine phosphatase [Smithella sp.]|jgi:protein-tyrosine phosphatase